MKLTALSGVLWIVAGITASNANDVSLNNSIKSRGFDFVCSGEQIVYWCSTLSTALDWTVTAGEDVVQAQFDASTNTPAEGLLGQLTATNTFLYFQFFDSQMISNTTIMTTSQLSIVLPPNSLNGSVTCQASINSATLPYMQAGIPTRLQNVTVSKLRENDVFCNYTYRLSWKPPINSDAVDLIHYTIVVDSYLFSVITHTNVPKYSFDINLCPGNHNISLYGTDRCQETTPTTSMNIIVRPPSVPNYIIVLITLSAISWCLQLCVCSTETTFTLKRKYSKKNCSKENGCKKRREHIFSAISIIGSAVLLGVSALLLIVVGIVIALYNGTDCFETCANFIIRRDTLAVLAFVIIHVKVTWIILLHWKEKLPIIRPTSEPPSTGPTSELTGDTNTDSAQHIPLETREVKT